MKDRIPQNDIMMKICLLNISSPFKWSCANTFLWKRIRFESSSNYAHTLPERRVKNIINCLLWLHDCESFVAAIHRRQNSSWLKISRGRIFSFFSHSSSWFDFFRLSNFSIVLDGVGMKWWWWWCGWKHVYKYFHNHFNG